MYRKVLLEMLLDHPMTLSAIAQQMDTAPRDVEQDLQHLLKSLKHMPYRVNITPAHCRHCGFVFDHDKLHKPGRCPACRKSWIAEPYISIERTGKAHGDGR